MKPSVEPTGREIQHTTCTLWEQEGRPSVRGLEFWLSARERLRPTMPAPGKQHLAKSAALAARNAQPPGRKKR